MSLVEVKFYINWYKKKEDAMFRAFYMKYIFYMK